MAQEFTINSSAIESKINQLLPSQGGFGAGVDFSASTMVIPIVDLTESAEGSSLRADLQTASSLGTSSFEIINQTTTITNTTGFFKLKISYVTNSLSVANEVSIILSDGTTTKKLFIVKATASSSQAPQFGNTELIVFVNSGETLSGVSANTSSRLCVSSHQVADISGNLTNPLGYL